MIFSVFFGNLVFSSSTWVASHQNVLSLLFALLGCCGLLTFIKMFLFLLVNLCVSLPKSLVPGLVGSVDWHVATNWQDGQVPTANDDVELVRFLLFF